MSEVKFFMPGLKEGINQEESYIELKHMFQSVSDERIYKLDGRHDLDDVTFIVGKPTPSKYGQDTVLAIFKQKDGKLFNVITVNRMPNNPIMLGEGNTYSYVQFK